MSLRQTRKAIFLDQMNQVVPGSRRVELIAPYCPPGHTGRPPFELETMQRTHFLQPWLNLSDPGMEEAVFDMPLCREFVGLAYRAQGNTVRLAGQIHVIYTDFFKPANGMRFAGRLALLQAHT